ncbi:MAG: dolichyl-phosphate beta-glucosyltransferase, partial [Candidatus Pacearchaeota archaeon]|nr:dolichyl-phosphate beta-glucosyltransferase [Candidatus Pacearchaeota archaeon]
MIRLSVIIPAYNEEKRLPGTLQEVGGYLAGQLYESEIIVVSDGSKDGTAEAAKKAGVMVIDRKENRGKGYSVREGMLASSGEIRLFMDADNATSVDHIEKMFPEFEKGAGVVIGSRDIAGAVIAVPQFWLRRRLGDVFNLIVQVVSGLWGIWDTQCGFKAFSAKAAKDIFPSVRIDRWAFDVELLVLAGKRGYGITQVPVRWVNAPDS